MREELRNKLDRHRSRFIEELDARTSFLESLVSEQVISHEDKATIQSEWTNHGQVDTLIEILLRKPDKMFDKFCNCLKIENSDLYDLLTGVSEVMFQKLNNNHDRFVNELDVSVTFLWQLLAKGVIDNEHENIIQSKTTPHLKADALIEILRRREVSKYYLFCDLLRNHNPDLADLLAESSRVMFQKLNNNHERFVKELYVSVAFLGELLAKGVIDNEHKNIIESKTNLYAKADALIEILKRRGVSKCHVFCDLLRNHNSDLADLLAESSNKTTNFQLYSPTNSAEGNPYSHDISSNMSGMEDVHSGQEDAASQNQLPVIVESSKLVIDELIGAGGYGKVYKARHLDFPGTVAYKRINAVLIQPWEAAELKGEAKIHMQLDHLNIVKCFAVVFEPENYGMILEFMKHGEAKNFLMNNNNLRSKMKIIKDVAAGMKYLHSIKPHAVIHGDLKLENVLISEDEIAKVCDFGFSRWKEYSKSHSVEAVPLGTVTHVPPERWRDCTVRKKEKFDVYSFGITMWEILTLKSPFSGEHRSALIKIWVEDGQRPDLGDIPKNVAENVVNLMVECWDGEKTKRPSFEDILTRLEMEL